jgi:hypothetical protein
MDEEYEPDLDHLPLPVEQNAAPNKFGKKKKKNMSGLVGAVEVAAIISTAIISTAIISTAIISTAIISTAIVSRLTMRTFLCRIKQNKINEY